MQSDFVWQQFNFLIKQTSLRLLSKNEKSIWNSMKHFKPWCIPAYFTNNCYTDCFRRIKSNKTIKLQRQKKTATRLRTKSATKKSQKDRGGNTERRDWNREGKATVVRFSAEYQRRFLRNKKRKDEVKSKKQEKRFLTNQHAVLFLTCLFCYLDACSDPKHRNCKKRGSGIANKSRGSRVWYFFGGRVSQQSGLCSHSAYNASVK